MLDGAVHYIRGLDDGKRLMLLFNPSTLLTPEDAAKAFYEQMKPVVTAYGQKPETELFLFTPEIAHGRGYGSNWMVSWEAGPYRWAHDASTEWCYNSPHWMTEPQHSFDLCFTRM